MPSVTDLEVEVCCLSDPGREPSKQVNEDAGHLQMTARGQLGLVCDGMGGHSHGQAASNTAVATIVAGLAQTASELTPGEQLVRAIQSANQAVYQQGGSAEMHARPGSTCVAVLLHEHGADIAHVGDSRAYLIRNGQIHRMTRDHSVVQQMLDAGMLTEEQAADHPDSNRITRALGMAPTLDVELRPGPTQLSQDDIFLLTSDGLTDLVSDQELLSLCQNRCAEGLSAVCRALIDTANLRGGHDNITALVMRVARLPASAAFATAPAAGPGHLPFEGPKTLVDPGAAPTQVDTTPPTVTVGEATPDGQGVQRAPADTHPQPGSLSPEFHVAKTRTGTEPGLQPSPFHAAESAQRGQFLSDYPERASKLSRNGKLLLVLAGLFTVFIVGSIILWWIVAALSSAAPDSPHPPSPSSPIFESGPRT